MRLIFRAGVYRAAALALICAGWARLGAQSATGLLSDATVLPSRAIRIGAYTAFTRFDELFGDGNSRNLAASLATDALGPKQFPSLAPSEADIRAASALPGFILNAGQLTAVANSRIVTAPLVAEYGLTHRLTIGAVIPLVETRTTLIAALNPKLGFANVGINPAYGANGAAVLSQNSALVGSLRSAASQLQSRLTLCQSTPSNPLCASIDGHESAVQSLIQNSGTFANSVERLYGTSADAHPGDTFVPLATNAAHVAVVQEVAAFAQQYQGFLNTSVVTGSVAGAAGPAARDQLQGLLAGLGHDSIQVADRSSIGDISVGATYQLANSFGDTSVSALQHPHYRLAVNGTFRIGTGEPANRDRFFDNGTGYGQNGVVGGVAGDLQVNRWFSASAVASYTRQLGTIDVNRVPNAANAAFPFGGPTAGTYTAGDVMSVSLLPRIRLSGYFSLNAQYTIVHTGADIYTVAAAAAGDTTATLAPIAPYGVGAATAQQVGFGFSYSTIVGPDRAPGRLPFEVSFSHLETLTASGGPVPKTFRDQIELRLFILH